MASSSPMLTVLLVEPGLADGRLQKGTREIECLGNVVLVGAYIIAFAFYLSLLSGFLLGIWAWATRTWNAA